MISSVKLLLWDQDTRAYKYYIETSVNKSDWTVVADHKNEASKSWQTLRFTERPVVFIRITGTDNTANKVGCVYVVELFLLFFLIEFSLPPLRMPC
jgi:hypothetical protein